ncbi:MAG: hypothetical protein NVS1B4_15420 [Gemmatimonadaceae bacterium]
MPVRSGRQVVGVFALVSTVCGCSGPALRYASSPLASDQACFSPGPGDYPVAIYQGPEVAADTLARFTDTAYVRTFLDGVVQRWPVPIPLPRQRVTVHASILRDGSVLEAVTAVSSGGPSFDARAVDAVRKAGADRIAGLLPPSYRRDTLAVIVRFGPVAEEHTMATVWLSELVAPRPVGVNPPPPYPAVHRDGRQGRVVVIAMVDTLGAVDARSVRVVSATDNAFAESVLGVLPSWHFEPAVVRGCKIAREIRLPFDFGPRQSS